jgi:hypothetical protein
MPDPYEPTNSADTTGTISSPGVTASGKIKRRAIKDAKQARNIITTLEMASRERNIKNARIQAKINSEKPFSQTSLEADGLGWKSNFTTKPLPMLIGKIAPRFVKAEQGIKYLVNSSLPDTHPGSAKKTEAFRREVTCTVRARPGWFDLIAEIAQENSLFGFTSVAWLDEFHWFPRHYRQDEFYVPSGTKHKSSSAQIVVLKDTYLIHELFALIEDNEAAAAAGWKIENTVLAINSAMPTNRRSQQTNWERIQEDLIRESTLGASMESGALSVVVYHLLAQEVTGTVSQMILVDVPQSAGGYQSYMTDVSREKEVLFEREDQFPNMEMAVSFFSFEQATGKLHGSKGIGRELYSMAGMLDRARNEIVDRLNLAGKLIITCDDKAVRRFKASIVGPALLIGHGYEVNSQRIDGDVEPFIAMDQFLTGLMDQMAGATTPKAFEGERVTKAAVDLFASREEESRDNIIGRFLMQLALMMQTIVHRLCDPDTADEDAKEMQERLLEVMTREELEMLREYPVAETVQDFTGLERQAIALIAQEARGNLLYNQREIERRKLSSQISDEFADAVLLPDEDPTELAEQTRLQQLELLLLAGQATQVPISPRDNHLVHLQTLMPALESTAQTAADPDPSAAGHGAEVMHALLDHANQHFAAAEAQGAPKEALSEIGKVLNQLTGAVEKISEQIQQQADLANQPEQLPPSPEQMAAAGLPPTQ